MNKKKILFLAPSLTIGGAERVLVNLLKRLDYDRYEVTLCLFANYGVYFDELPRQIRVIHLFSNVFLSRVFTWIEKTAHTRVLIDWVAKATVREHYDVGICFSDGLLTNTLVATRSRYNKLVTWVHSCYLAQSDLKAYYSNKNNVCRLLRSRYDYIDRIVCVSKQSLSEFNQIFKCEGKSEVIYNLFDSSAVMEKAKAFVPQYENSRSLLRVVSIGRLVGVKKLDRLLDAKKILQDQGVDFALDIVGNGPEGENLKAIVEKNNIKDVKFWGFQSNPYPLLANSDILALTSESEAFPTVLIEAMLLGKPIVATKCSGCVEITDGGSYGLLCEHNAKDIAAKLKLLLESKEERERFAAYGKERLAVYSERKTLDAFDNLIMR